MRRSPITVFAAGMALLLPVLFTTAIAASSWLLRYAALALVLGVGLPALASLVRDPRTRRPAVLGAAFAAWCLVCTAFARYPIVTLFGTFGLGTGALFSISLVAAWAIGASVDEKGPALIEKALLVAAAINIAVAIAQMATDLKPLGLDLLDRRSSGLLGNPVFLAELLVGAFWLVLLRSPGRWPAWALYAVGIGAGLQVSGSRLPLAIAILALPVAAFFIPKQFVAAIGVALVLGIGLGTLLTQHAGGASTSSRLAEPLGASGNRARLETWRAAGTAIAQRPIVGFGPGRYNEATGPLRSYALGRAGPDKIFIDAHNLLIEYTTTTGLPGLALLVTFLIAIVRRRITSVPLLGFGLAILDGHLVEPQNVAVTPLAFLALGAATAEGPALRPLLPTVVRALAAVIGTGLTAQLLVGGYYFQEAALDFNLDRAHAALRLLPPWPQTAALVGRVYTFQSKTTRHRPDLVRQARRWQRIAALRDPSNATQWQELAEGQLADGNRQAARASLRASLHWNPWSTRGLDDLGTLELSEHHWDAAIRAFEKSLRAKPVQPEAQRLLDQARAEKARA